MSMKKRTRYQDVNA